MSWTVRHAGSPRVIEGLTLSQVAQGLEEARWDVTDEVMGPHDRDWVVIEQHPQLEEFAAALEPPPRHAEDETRLDFNPLIDVALVLLIFFILTTSYAALQKVLDMPSTTARDAKGVLTVDKKKVEQTTIKVEARQESGKTVIRVEDEVVEADPAALVRALVKYYRPPTKTEMLLDARGVDWGTVVLIQDAAAGANIKRVNYLLPSAPK
jgi:biopolymer transport protein ExbD